MFFFRFTSMIERGPCTWPCTGHGLADADDVADDVGEMNRSGCTRVSRRMTRRDRTLCQAPKGRTISDRERSSDMRSSINLRTAMA